MHKIAYTGHIVFGKRVVCVDTLISDRHSAGYEWSGGEELSKRLMHNMIVAYTAHVARVLRINTEHQIEGYLRKFRV